MRLRPVPPAFKDTNITLTPLGELKSLAKDTLSLLFVDPSIIFEVMLYSFFNLFLILGRTLEKKENTKTLCPFSIDS